MRIQTSLDGSCYVNAISEQNGVDVEGHVYQMVSGTDEQSLRFQLGPVKEAGLNGCQNEQVLAVLIHRLGVLNRLLPTEENGRAIDALEEALLQLEKRRRDRERRGVEGTSSP